MRILISRFAAVSAVVAGLSPVIQEAYAAPVPVGNLAPIAAEALPVQDTQFLFGGRNYCFYPDGWHGPGWYWCGYAYRRGFGWGGGSGWNGWHGGGGGGFRRGGGGGGGGFHPGGGHPGGGHPGGGHPGGGHPGGGHGHGH